eukprot:Selendium_serpulae@DN5973_c0_g1_i10.p1
MGIDNATRPPSEATVLSEATLMDDLLNQREGEDKCCKKRLGNVPCVPSWTPLYMAIFLIVMVFIVYFTTLTKYYESVIVTLMIYLGLSLLLLLIIAVARYIVVSIVLKLTGGSRVLPAFVTVIDPEWTMEIIWAIVMPIFWSQMFHEYPADEPLGSTSTYSPTGPPSSDPPDIRSAGYFLLWDLEEYLLPASARLLLWNCEVFILLWAIRNAFCKILVFNFNLGFLMELNEMTVKYCRVSSYVRRLNLGWWYYEEDKSALGSPKIGIIRRKPKTDDELLDTFYPVAFHPSIIDKCTKHKLPHWLNLQYMSQTPMSMYFEDGKNVLVSSHQAVECAKELYHRLVSIQSRPDLDNPEFMPSRDDGRGERRRQDDDPLDSAANDWLVHATKPTAEKNTRPMLSLRDLEHILRDPDAALQVMKDLDYGGYGSICERDFRRAVLQSFQLRRQLIRTVESQAGIARVLEGLISIVMTTLLFIVFLLIIGTNFSTIIISGAAILSSLAFILSYIWTLFIDGVIFVVKLNPYNTGDRVRINKGELMIADKITTFYTVFVTLHGKPITVPHSILSKKKIYNESRAKESTFEILLEFDPDSVYADIEELKKRVRIFIADRKVEYVRGSLHFLTYDYQPGDYISMGVWVSHVEGWHNWNPVFNARTKLYHFINGTCQVLGLKALINEI